MCWARAENAYRVAANRAHKHVTCFFSMLLTIVPGAAQWRLKVEGQRMLASCVLHTIEKAVETSPLMSGPRSLSLKQLISWEMAVVCGLVNSKNG